ncbi:hypothetical protein FS837_005167 [Tulasnella sp. UAMH 9824]|nr:hypothetical protein FS837_005167 [Tulasnella sp. UAMH 9824]
MPPSSDHQSNPPALKGDANGVYRIRVIGNCGTGKSTLAAELSELLHLPLIKLDHIFWKPDRSWENVSDEEFDAELWRQAKEHEKTGWVMEGNYRKLTGKVTKELVTDIVWLDLPFPLYFFRLFIRTVRRILHLDSPPQVGCQENLAMAFASKDSILWIAITKHDVVRKHWEPLMAEDLANNSRGWTRIGGWGSQLRMWMKSVKELARSR